MAKDMASELCIVIHCLGRLENQDHVVDPALCMISRARGGAMGRITNGLILRRYSKYQHHNKLNSSDYYIFIYYFLNKMYV